MSALPGRRIPRPAVVAGFGALGLVVGLIGGAMTDEPVAGAIVGTAAGTLFSAAMLATDRWSPGPAHLFLMQLLALAVLTATVLYQASFRPDFYFALLPIAALAAIDVRREVRRRRTLRPPAAP